MPPQWMWHLEPELDIWFERVKDQRNEKYGISDDSRETVPMVQNELAAEWRK